MNRYENRGVQTNADVLNKIAELLDTSSVDFLINEDTEEKARVTLNNAGLLQKLKEMEKLPENELEMLLKVVGACLRDFKTRQAYPK